jgi:hypothetical protein
MFDSMAQTLDQIGSLAFWTCMTALVAIDGLAIAVVLRTRSRELVNRWTGRMVAANLLLLGAGLGVPVTTYVAKSIVLAVAPSVQPTLTHAGESALTPPK